MKTHNHDQLLSRVITGGIFPPKLNITSPDAHGAEQQQKGQTP